MKQVYVLGVKTDNLSQAEALERARKFLQSNQKHFIVTPNPEIILKSLDDENLREILNYADLSLPDGFGLILASKILKSGLKKRIAGADFMLALSVLAQEDGYSVFLLGGKDEMTSQNAAANLNKVCPNLRIVGATSGGEVFYKNKTWQTQDKNIINNINKSKAEILFVAFGCPKQEKWIFNNLDKLESVKIAITVGGSFDYLSGNIKRAPNLFKKFGIEWLWRLIQEPSRIKRINNAVFVFLAKVIKWKINIMKNYRKNVAGFIVNKNNKVLIVKRVNSRGGGWQIPQGGVDEGETEEEAIMREMKEETGVNNYEILGEHSEKYAYDWPQWHQQKGGYKGQSQKIFYLFFKGEDNDIKVDNREHDDYKWVSVDDVVLSVQEVRQEMAEMAVAGYKELANSEN